MADATLTKVTSREDEADIEPLIDEAEEEKNNWGINRTALRLFWKYQVQEEIVGFLKEIPMKGDTGLIHFLYIRPKHRGNGYGSDMVRRWSRRFDQVLVEIRDEEIEEFYRKIERDFRKVKVHKDWEDHPELDFSEGDRIPNSPYIEYTDEVL